MNKQTLEIVKKHYNDKMIFGELWYWICYDKKKESNWIYTRETIYQDNWSNTDIFYLDLKVWDIIKYKKAYRRIVDLWTDKNRWYPFRKILLEFVSWEWCKWCYLDFIHLDKIEKINLP